MKTAWDLGKDVTYEILIANLGGYEKAKFHLRNLGNEHERTLLQHRREHGIFEVGDCVIVDGHEGLYQIQYVYEGACGYGMWQGRRFSHSMIERHANDEEIKAGKRLEVG